VAVDEREQRMVFADAYVGSRMNQSAALASDDAAGANDLAAVHFDAEPFGLRIAAVTRASARLFVCHGRTPLRLFGDAVDAELGVALPVALVLLVMLAPPHFENFHLLAAALRKDRSLDCRAGNDRLTQSDGVAFADDHQDLVEYHFCADVSQYPFDFQFFAGGDLVLLTAGFYDRVHG